MRVWALFSALMIVGGSAGASAEESGPCGIIIHDLKVQIEEMKALKVRDPLPLSSGGKKKAAPESPQKALARERAQTDDLNKIVQGMGCDALDIDQELAKPADPAFAPKDPEASGKSKKHHKPF